VIYIFVAAAFVLMKIWAWNVVVTLFPELPVIGFWQAVGVGLFVGFFRLNFAAPVPQKVFKI